MGIVQRNGSSPPQQWCARRLQAWGFEYARTIGVFREQARRQRTIAQGTKDKSTRDELIRVAIEYDKPAGEAEKAPRLS